MAPPLRVYLLVMVAPAAVLTAAVARELSAPSDAVLMVVLIALGAVATNFPVRISRHYKAHAAPAIHLAAVLLFSPAAAVAVIGSSALLGEGVLCLRRNPATGFRRRQPVDVVFNTSQLMLAGGLSALVYATAGAPLAGAFLAAAVMYTASTGLVVLAGAIHDKRNPLELWAEIAASDLKQTTALYVAGYLLALLSVGRPWLALVMMVPIAAIQLALTRSVQLMEQTIDAVEAMADVVDRRDPYTFQHSQSVADHSVRKAREAEVALGELLRGRGTQWDASVVDAFAESLPGAIPAVDRPRWTDVRPLLRSLGAAVGVIG